MRATSSSGSSTAGEDRLTDFDAFGSNPGALRARIYIPADLPEMSPLVAVLHGCKQTAAEYDKGAGWSELADRLGFALLFPEQQRANTPNLCFNWFVPADARRDSGEAASISQMVEHVARRYRIDPRRIYVTGLSAGGAMTMVMLATYPDIFAGGAVIAGLPYGVATTVPEAFDRMRGHGLGASVQLEEIVRAASQHGGRWPTLSVWHGTADHTVVPSNAEAILAQWRGLHCLGHAPTRTEKIAGHHRRVWVGRDGREAIEAYTISEMSHGTPIDAASPDGVGSAGPFILDVGISSTHQIARFWGLDAGIRGADANATERAVPMEKLFASAQTVAQLSSRGKEDGAQSPGGPSVQPKRVPVGGVQKVIEDALRAAGLMK